MSRWSSDSDRPSRRGQARPRFLTYKDKFCNRCSAINWDGLLSALEKQPYIRLYPEPLSKDQFDNYKCDLCLKIDRAIGEPRKSKPRPDELYLVNLLNQARDFNLQVIKVDASATEAFGENPSTAVCGSSGLSIVKITRTWLDECIAEHPRCRSSRTQYRNVVRTEESPLPTRVIDVHNIDEYGNLMPRIFTSKGMRGRYATLSYVWGKGARFTTTLQNLEQMKDHIKISELPKMFQDAISLTRTLGISYLWIDALCIVQDSLEDKEDELGRMMGIYQNSTITLAAVGQNSVHSSLTAPKLSETLDPATSAGAVYIQMGHPGTLHNPLHTRAWCLQETLLSRRILVLGLQEVFWFCQSYQRQSSTHDSRTRRKPRDYEAEIYGPLSRENVLDQDLAERPYNFWYNTIAKYSKRSLTFSEDRLPAIGGVAALMAEQFLHTGSKDYLAGLWREDLFRGLLWRGLHTDPWKFQDLSQYCPGPSWTWATWGTEVSWRRHVAKESSEKTSLVEQLAFIRYCGVSLLSERLPYGQVSRGELVLRGRLSPLKAHRNRIMPYFDRFCSCHDDLVDGEKIREDKCPDCVAYINAPALIGDSECICLRMTPSEALILVPWTSPNQLVDEYNSDFDHAFVRVGILVARSVIKLDWSSENQAVLII